MNESLIVLLAPLAFTSAWLIQFHRSVRKHRHSGWRWTLLGNALGTLFALSLLFAGGEVYFRFISDTTDSNGLTLPTQEWMERHWHTNSWGARDCRDYTLTAPPGKKRIVFVGDSFTAGHGVKDVNDCFTSIIQKRHGDWDVLNCGRPGWDTVGEIAMAQWVRKSHCDADIVVLVYTLNDVDFLMPRWVEHLKRVNNDPFRASWICQNSYFVSAFYYRLPFRPDGLDYFGELRAAYAGPVWDEEKAKLIELRSIVESGGDSKLLVVTFPFLHDPTAFQAAHDRIDAFWKSNGVPHLDLLDTFKGIPPKQIMVNSRDGHPNEYAHQLAADAIDRFLSTNVSSRTLSPSSSVP